MVNDYCGLGDPKKAAQKNLEHNNVPWFYVSENGKSITQKSIIRLYSGKDKKPVTRRYKQRPD